MLPLLKDCIEKTELSFFVKRILPLAQKLRVRFEFFKKKNQMIEAKIFDTLQNQLWALLPGFCDFASDFDESFKVLAKTLGEVLEKCADLRGYVLQSIRTAINRNTDENRAIMAKYAKNYLPLMFNIYTTEIRLDKDPSRQSLIDTIKCYLKITDNDLVNTYLVQAIKNYELHAKKHEETKSADVNNNQNDKPKVVFDFNKQPTNKQSIASLQAEPFLFAKHSFLDLIAILAKYSNAQNIQNIFEMSMQAIGDKKIDKTAQKKFYKILDSILSSGKPSNQQQQQNVVIFKFVQSKFQTIGNVFAKSLADCNSAAKVPRLKCLLDLMDYVQSPEHKLFLKQVLPEIIISIREINHKSREAAFQLLNSMLKLWQKLGLESQPPVTELGKFINLY